ncbi:hypothetical protein JCGZ_19533 [Jatropha curcas]|uniref:Aminotransferase-like plant mobile domain-containing protein n=1 Tax=Jatropha curcas TaxID=180498 RepID=A0A067K1R3_JATCU|nr:hypothetical protein JCGZ_19533 [Jatropha curcas]
MIVKASQKLYHQGQVPPQLQLDPEHATHVPAQRYQELYQRFCFARTYVARLNPEHREMELEIGRLRRHQTRQAITVSHLQMENDRLHTRLEDLSDEDFLGSLGISLDEVNVTADVDTHASVTGVYAQTWAFEYFPYTRPELIHADLGLVPLAWRWYRMNLQTALYRKSLRDLRTFFDTCTVGQVEAGAMNVRLQGWIEADPHFRRSEALSRRRFILSHPVLQRYYLGLAHLRLPYSISYYTPDGTLVFLEVSLENVDHLDLPPEDITETWAFEYFPYTRPELIHADLGLVPLAWRWYRMNLQTALYRKSLRDLRTFFDTCTVGQVEAGAMNVRLQGWIEADPHFRRSEALSRRRFILSHPVLQRYYLGERVDFQIRGCRSVPFPPPEDMRAGK